MIKIIIENYVTRTDSNGNRYWKSKIINCRTNNMLIIDTPHSSNTYGMVRSAGYEWDNIHEVVIDDIKQADFRNIKPTNQGYMQSDDIVKNIKCLNRTVK